LRALSIKEKLLGPQHPDVAMTLNNLAVLYKTQQRYDEAENFYRRALSIFERALDPTHQKVITALMNLARLLQKVGRSREALDLEARADAPQLSFSLEN
jgi:tetratricopeptide (TPR) repeat protein